MPHIKAPASCRLPTNPPVPWDWPLRQPPLGSVIQLGGSKALVTCLALCALVRRQRTQGLMTHSGERRQDAPPRF